MHTALITPASVCVAHRDDPAALQVLRILEDEVACPVRPITDEVPTEPFVGFLTSNLVHYPNRYFRVLVAEPPFERAQQERARLIEKCVWLRSAGLIICINPIRLHPDGRHLENRTREREYDSVVTAVKGLCGYRKLRSDPLAGYSPDEKKRIRKARRDRDIIGTC